jgi:hypothetical protein
MKQTALEWLIYIHFGGIDNVTPDFRNKIEQAIEMEKQQIVDAYDVLWVEHIKNGEDYYNETFKITNK